MENQIVDAQVAEQDTATTETEKVSELDSLKAQVAKMSISLSSLDLFINTKEQLLIKQAVTKLKERFSYINDAVLFNLISKEFIATQATPMQKAENE